MPTCARSSFLAFFYFIISTTIRGRMCHCPHFTDEETLIMKFQNTVRRQEKYIHADSAQGSSGAISQVGGQQTFPGKGQMVNISGFRGHTASVTALQPCPGSTNAATRDTEVAGWAVVRSLYRTRRRAWPPVGCSVLTPDLGEWSLLLLGANPTQRLSVPFSGLFSAKCLSPTCWRD